MATITRIEVGNFLCDGYIEGHEWVPLYRGETFRLFGRSSALQIDNGGGKTSLTESCLYLLSQDGRLKPKIADRIAPPENGWTHIRMEFVEKPHDEDILQRDLITLAPEDIPGVTYVIGLAWSRGKDPSFYCYQGLLSDAPCFQKEPSRLQLIDNETFKKSVERMPGARWNKWRTQREWLEEIRQFTNVEVVKKNVEFQLAGAGDYSAMINKVEPENGESYDAAFFRLFVAPELLRQSMGTEGEDDEEHFEDTLYKTLKPTADALVNINLRQHELDDAEAALAKFEPVEAKAREVLDVNAVYEEELSNVVRDAAVVHILAVKDPIPGMPVIAFEASWRKDGKLAAAISSLVIDKRAGVLITDQGLAKLLGWETGRLNQQAQRLHLTSVVCGSQTIDISCDLKESPTVSTASAGAMGSGYPIENTCDLKESKRGQHRKYSLNGYSLDDAKTLLPAGDAQNLDGLLTRAFGIAIDSIDTNPYRKTQREISIQLQQAQNQYKVAVADFTHWSNEYDGLMAESRDAEENQVSYETYAARADQFLPEHKNTPLEAKTWATKALNDDQQALSDHGAKVADLTGDFRIWERLKANCYEQALPDALVLLMGKRDEVVAAGESAQDAMQRACSLRNELRPKYTAAVGKLEEVTKVDHRLRGLADVLPVFRELFGDVDPQQQNPTDDLATVNKQMLTANERLSKARAARDDLESLKPLVKVFRKVFGDADPSVLTPTQDLLAQKEQIAIEEVIMADHQSYVEAATQFRETHGQLMPEQWLTSVEQQRASLLAERQKVEQSINDISEELDGLDAFAVADNRTYANALVILAKDGVAFERLHSVVMAEAGERRQALLSLFSAALSAPVVRSVEEADKATQALERAKLTIPVFLLAPLQQFIQSGGYEITGDVTHTFLAGRLTRQVRILLNPSLINEEKVRLGNEANDLNDRNSDIGSELDGIAPSSEGVTMALKAREALRRGSENKYMVARAEFDRLSRNVASLQFRVDASDSITAMKRYSALGDEEAWQTLVANTIPDEEDRIRRFENEINRLKPLVAEKASRALIAAKDFYRAGGEMALKQAQVDVAHFESKVRDLALQLDDLCDKIEGELAAAQQSASALLTQIDKTFGVDKRDLETAIAFEVDGSAEFMATAEVDGKTRQGNVDTSIARLQGIDFDRAYRYIQSSRVHGRALADRIADALGKRNAAARRRTDADDRRNDLDGQISVLQPFADELHDAIAEIKEQYAKIAGFSDDIRARVATEGNARPEILGYVEALRTGCLGKLPSTATETKAAIANLRESIKALDIDTKTLAQRRQAKIASQSAFKMERDHFCEQARNGHIKGLQLPEIERIAEATNLAQLGAIRQIREKIKTTIDEYAEKLAKLREAMETNKSATIDNLVHFARQAKANLTILDDVMKRTPDARFFVEAEVADEATIQRIIESLISEIQDREQAARDRNPVALNKDIERRNKSYKDEIHRQIYANIFAKERVYFTHAAIWNGAKSPLAGEGSGLSTGQRAALMMMWLIKQAEYSLTRAALMYGSRKQQKAALKSAQRIMFFDGLFSNLSNEDYIDHAFQGLKDVDENFQLIGLIHNPHYVNNKDIFPVHLVGKKKVAIKGGMRRRFVTVEPWQEDNGMITYTSAYRGDRPTGDARG